MEYFDTHSHYNDEKFEEDREEVLKQVYKEGVTKLVVAGYDVESSKKAIELAKENNYIYAICGISPNDVKKTIEETQEEIEKLQMMLKQDKIVAIGEIGLDYYWNTENKEIQKYAFIQQIKIANENKFPIVIHTREAVSDTLEILKNIQKAEYTGIFHCCPFNRELVKEALKLGFTISFAGPTTFKNAKNASEIVELVPIDKMVIETDCPYLAPEPVRGTRNDSRNLKYIVEKIAKVKEKEEFEIAEITYKNALKLFKI